MAGNKVLQILRGNNSAISSSTDTLLPGQPLYNVDRKYLIVGDDSNTQIKDATPVTTDRLVSYNSNNDSVASLQLDSNGNIVASGNSIQLECNDPSKYSISLGTSGLSINVANITSTASIINFNEDVTISRSDDANIILSEENFQLTIPNITSTASTVEFTSDNPSFEFIAPTLTSTGNFTVDSDNIYLGSEKAGNVYVKGLIDIYGNAELDGKLNVTGDTTLSALTADSISSTSITNSEDITTSTITVSNSATISELTAPNAVLDSPTITNGKISNPNVSGGSATELTTVSTASLTIGNWTITTSGNNLRFTYNDNDSNYVEFEASPCAINVHHS